MKRGKSALLVLAALALFNLTSCGGKKTRVPPKDPEALYRKGLMLLNEGRYKKAEEAFSRLKSYFPERRDLMAKAELKLADCAYLSKDYPEAISRYGEFKRRHPFHPDVPYAEFQIAMAYFRQMRPKDRDQAPTRKALSAFENVLRNYPGTIFAKKAASKIALCKRRLAEHEIYVGKFYLKKKKLKAACDRFKAALAYHGSGLEAEALYLLALTLHKMGKDEEAASFLALLEREFPNGKYAREARALRTRLKAKGTKVAKLPLAPPSARSTPAQGLRIIAEREESTTSGMKFYIGDVKLSWEDLSLRAEEARVRYEAGTPTEVIAKGEVKVNYGPREILCREARLYPKEKVLVMEGNPRYNEPGLVIRGRRMVLHLDTGRLEIEGKKVEKIEVLEGT